jgi:RNA polymerase sigma factor (sigma-70 family)
MGKKTGEPACERRLLENLSRGDLGAFWQLWLRHRPHLFAVCLRRMHPADAEDAISRSMLLAREKLPAYADVIIDLEAWLTRLTSNVCLDLLKERGRRLAGAAFLDDDVLTRREATFPQPLSPEDWLMSEEIAECIVGAIDALPPSLRDTATLRFLHEESYADIAASLGIEEANARKRVQHARTLLKEKLTWLRPPRGDELSAAPRE